MGRQGTSVIRDRHCRPEGTPSGVMERLCELGNDVKLGYLLAAAARKSVPSTAGRMEDVARKRADRYDEDLASSLEWLELIRKAKGEDIAAVMERRFIDGARWQDTLEGLGYPTPNNVSRVINDAFDFLDEQATVQH